MSKTLAGVTSLRLLIITQKEDQVYTYSAGRGKSLYCYRYWSPSLTLNCDKGFASYLEVLLYLRQHTNSIDCKHFFPTPVQGLATGSNVSQ